MAALGAILFSGKAIVIKLAYHHPVDASTLLAMRMLLSIPFFVAALWWSDRKAQNANREGRTSPHTEPLQAADYGLIIMAGLLGYYAASLLDFMGLQYISAGLERLILFTYPSIVLLITSVMKRHWPGWWAIVSMGISYAGLMMVYGHEASLEGGQVALGAALVMSNTIEG